MDRARLRLALEAVGLNQIMMSILLAIGYRLEIEARANLYGNLAVSAGWGASMRRMASASSPGLRPK